MIEPFWQEKNFPQKISVIIKIIPEKILFNPQLILPKHLKKLYEIPHDLQNFGQCAALSLQIIDVLGVEEKLTDKWRSKILYQYKFGYQSEDLKIPQEDGVMQLWNYGGYYHAGCPINQIEQLFFSMVSGDIQITRAAFWLKKGIVPPNSVTLGRDKLIFANSKKYLSLQDLVKSGDITLNFNEITYKSSHLQHADTQTDLAELIMIKE